MPNDFQPSQWDKQQRNLGASFLQSAHWAQFQEAVSHRPHFLSGDGWSCLVFERKAALGRYLFAPYGPTIANPSAAVNALNEIKDFGRTKKFDWLRLEPILTDLPLAKQRNLLKSNGRLAPHEAEPHLTRIVDLNRPVEEILASLSQTTRNIIRRDQRQKLLTYKTSRDPDDIGLFTTMLKMVASRKKVNFFSENYYRRQAEILMPAGLLVLEIAYDNRQPVATALIHDFNQTATYTNAASLPEARDQNVSALLLWRCMLNAKDRGNRQIDLYGVAPDDAPPSHPWYGFSGFKKKFGGQVVEYAGTWDIPLTKKYQLYRSAVTAKKLFKRR